MGYSEADLKKLMQEGKIRGFFVKSEKPKKPPVQKALPFNEKEMHKKPRKKKSNLEYKTQVICVDWFDQEYPQHWQDLYHIPNQANKNALAGHQLNLMGRRDGVWDMKLDLSFTDASGRYWEGDWFEFKTDIGDLSEEQKQFRDKRVHRCKFHEIRSLDEFMFIIISRLGKGNGKYIGFRGYGSRKNTNPFRTYKNKNKK